jgi:hypothetical protein
MIGVLKCGAYTIGHVHFKTPGSRSIDALTADDNAKTSISNAPWMINCLFGEGNDMTFKRLKNYLK